MSLSPSDALSGLERSKSDCVSDETEEVIHAIQGKPPSILKKKGSFDNRSHIQPILKRNSLGPEIAMSTVGQTPQVHPILKKSTSEDRPCWQEERPAPKPILKKRDSGDELKISGIKPILKRPQQDTSTRVLNEPRSIIKPLSRTTSEETKSPSVTVTQEDIEEGLKQTQIVSASQTPSNPLLPRRRSHPS